MILSITDRAASRTIPTKGENMTIGLMGVTNNGTLVTPGGKRLFRLPLRLACIVQRAQHFIARFTH